MKVLELINDGNIDLLSAAVFNQKLDETSSSGFTQVLSDEEEVAVVKRLLSAEDAPAWDEFLTRYTSCYPLSNPAIRLLLHALDNPLARKQLIQDFSRYGHTPEAGLFICNLVYKSGLDDYAELLETMCNNTRFYDQEVDRFLERIDDRCREANRDAQFAKTYKTTAENYHNNSGKYS